MENYIVVLLLAIVVLMGAVYVSNVEKRFVQSKEDMEKVKVELESTKHELKRKHG